MVWSTAPEMEPAVAAEGLYWAGNAALALNKHAEAAALFAECGRSIDAERCEGTATQVGNAAGTAVS